MLITVGTLSISSLAATSGSNLRYWVWSSDTSGNITFSNYKVKVNITKVQTKTIAFNDNYGTLPVPKREGFTFGIWFSGLNLSLSYVGVEDCYCYNGKTRYPSITFTCQE